MIMFYLAICLVIIGYFGSALIAWQSVPQRTLITYLALICACLGTVGAILITIDSSQTTDKLITKNEQISKLSLQLYSSSKQLQVKSDQIAQLYNKLAETQEKLRIKSEKLSEMSLQSLYSITGGDSYCFVVPSLLKGVNSQKQWVSRKELAIVHVGKYPLYDVQLSFTDVSKHNFVTIDDIVNSKLVANLGNLSPGLIRHIPELTYPSSNEAHYRFTFATRSGMIYEDLLLKKQQQDWAYALRVYKSSASGKKILFEKSKNFPLNNKGTIEWNN